MNCERPYNDPISAVGNVYFDDELVPLDKVWHIRLICHLEVEFHLHSQLSRKCFANVVVDHQTSRLCNQKTRDNDGVVNT